MSVKSISSHELREYREAFDYFDSDKSGHIEMEELKGLLKMLSRNHKITSRMAAHMMKIGDTDGDGKISFDEFCVLMRREKETEVEIQKAFRAFDKNGDGFITPQELKQVMRGVGEDLTDKQAHLMIKCFDDDNDGKLNILEFSKLFEEI